MKVKDLIEELEGHDPELDVVFAFGSGDYWRTEVAEDVELTDVGYVEHSEYHRKWATVDEEKAHELEVTGEHPSKEKFKKAVIIR